MDVDDAVQDKVEREVGSLENIRGDDSRVDWVSNEFSDPSDTSLFRKPSFQAVGCTGSKHDSRVEELHRIAAYDVVVKLHQLGRCDQYKVHADNGHEGRGHAAAARRRHSCVNRIQAAHSTGLAQRTDHVHVAVDKG